MLCQSMSMIQTPSMSSVSRIRRQAYLYISLRSIPSRLESVNAKSEPFSSTERVSVGLGDDPLLGSGLGDGNESRVF